MHHRYPQWGFARCIALATLLAGAAAAQAAHTVYVYQSGPDVIAQGSGPINTAGITLFGNTGNFIPDVQANVGRIAIGTAASTQWQGISGPTSFGNGGQAFATSVTGNFVGVVGVNNSIRLPNGYVSGAPLQNSARWNGRTLASLGLNVGTYTYTWGSGPTSDSLTLVIGSAPPVAPSAPATVPTLSQWGLILLSLLLASFGGAMSRQRC